MTGGQKRKELRPKTKNCPKCGMRGFKTESGMARHQKSQKCRIYQGFREGKSEPQPQKVGTIQEEFEGYSNAIKNSRGPQKEQQQPLDNQATEEFIGEIYERVKDDMPDALKQQPKDLEWFDHTQRCVKCQEKGRLMIDIATTEIYCQTCNHHTGIYVKQTPVPKSEQKEPRPSHGNKWMPAMYANYFGIMKDVAQKHGYALAAHGSFIRDMDLVAIPWVNNPAPQEVLIQSLREALGYEKTDKGKPAVSRPQGRTAYVIDVGGGGYIDISVMPIISQGQGAKYICHNPTRQDNDECPSDDCTDCPDHEIRDKDGDISNFLFELGWCPHCQEPMPIHGHGHFCEACKESVAVPDELPEKAIKRIMEYLKDKVK